MQQERLIKIEEVLSIVPVSRSTWFAGIRSGIYPKQIKLGERSSAWKLSDINKLIEELSS